ncbi:MAG: DUF1800 domain-containing protein [Candidatus Kapabacteria bacterium]|nr:DUF1800 domain-containing protein [Candidatus Kapabacteria bacterium]
MKRRDFLSGFVGNATVASKRSEQFLEEPSGGLEKYEGIWSRAEAAHLAKRTLFGYNKSDLDTLSAMSMEDAVAKLLEPAPEPDLPKYPFKDESGIAYGETWINTGYDPMFDGNKLQSLLSWWVGNMLAQNLSITEKLMLFWHNHYVTESLIVSDSKIMYKYLELIRKNSLGNIQTFTEEMTISPAMLLYLNGDTNILGSPNENYARELFELFTIGKGPNIAPGDYTTYTEEDVLEASRVLTGWRANKANAIAFFLPKRHDAGIKKFSKAFDFAEISNEGANEYKTLISMIFAKFETALNLTRAIYKWFVYYEISEETEKNVIQPLAKLLIENNYEIKPVLKALFESAHFYDMQNRAVMIKNPFDFLIGMYKNFDTEFPDIQDYEKRHTHLFNFGFYQAFVQGMFLSNPPSVAGWPAYHQEPSFYRSWASSVSIQYRTFLSDVFILNGLKQAEFTLQADLFKVVANFSQPEKHLELIKDALNFLLPDVLAENIIQNQSMMDYFSEVVLQTNPDYEWTSFWLYMVDNPDNKEVKNAILYRLKLLFRSILSSADYHLM